MAYVGISKALIQEVRNQINIMRVKESDAVPDSTENLKITGNEQWFQEAMWGENYHLVSSLPSKWFRTGSTRCTVYHNWPADMEFNLENRRLRSEFELAAHVENVQMPHHVYNNSGFMVKLTEEQSVAMGLGNVPNEIAQRKEIHERWQGVRRQVLEFLESCKSLNEALKLFPQIRVYIPKDYLDKLDEKREGKGKSESKAAEVLANIDVDAIQASFVMSRLTSSN